MPAARRAVFGIDAEWRPIAPQARVVWGVTGSVLVLILLLPMTVVAAVAFGPAALGVGLVLSAVVVGLVWWRAGRRARSWGFALRQNDLVICSGLLFRRLTIVPFGRMQLIDIAQGPLDRRLGLATVQMHTAAAASDARIPLLPAEEAHQLRDRLTALGEALGSGT